MAFHKPAGGSDSLACAQACVDLDATMIWTALCLIQLEDGRTKL